MTISKRNGKYYCRFQVNRERHHKLCVGATTKAEAEKMENAFKYKLMQQQNGVIQKEKIKITLSRLLQIYLKYSETNKKSFKTDKCRISIIQNYFKNIKYIDDIKPNNIEKFKMFLITENRSKTTVNRYLEILSKMFNIAVDNEWLVRNPIKKDMRFPVKNYTIRYLKQDEEKQLFLHCPDYFKPILVVALQTGLRKTNIRELKWSNINMEFRLIEITENKGNKHIKIYMNDILYNLFKSLPKEDEEYVFINPKTKNIYSDVGFKRIWYKIKEDAKIENLRFHDLRHTVGTRLAQANIPVPVIREILAHSDIKTTMRYVHTAREEVQRAMQVLNSYS